MIFLSYCWKDQKIAHSIDDLLRRQSLDVWIDFRCLDTARNITEQLDIAIRNCWLFLSIHPENRERSPWMTAELSMASTYAKPVLHLITGADELSPAEGQGLGALLANYLQGRLSSAILPLTINSSMLANADVHTLSPESVSTVQRW